MEVVTRQAVAGVAQTSETAGDLFTRRLLPVNAIGCACTRTTPPLSEIQPHPVCLPRVQGPSGVS